MKKNVIALVCIVKNEADYILEWVAHYRLIGIADIIIYNNESADQTGELLEHLQNRGAVRVLNWTVPEGTSPQLSAYADARIRLSDQYDFLAFFDADEFLIPRVDFNFSAWLSTLGNDVGAVAVNQRVFGSSGQKVKSPGLVIKRFVRAAAANYDENYWVKSIYRCSHLKNICSPHRGLLHSGRYILPNGIDAFGTNNETGRATNIDFSRLQLNHYIIKSEEEFLAKRARGGGMGATIGHRLKRYEDLNFFHGRDAYINAVVDETLAKQSPVIEAEMRRLADRVKGAQSPAEFAPNLATL